MIYLVVFPRSFLLLLSLLCCSLDKLHASLDVSQLQLFLAQQPLELLDFELAAEQGTLKIKQGHLLLTWGTALRALKRAES